MKRIARIAIPILALIAIVVSFAFAHAAASKKVVDPASFPKAGAAVKARFPEYAKVNDSELGRLLFGKGYLTDQQHAVLRDRGFSDKAINNLVDRNYARSNAARIGIYVGWLIAAVALWFAGVRLRRRFTPEAHAMLSVRDAAEDGLIWVLRRFYKGYRSVFGKKK